jgi:hypothetical protein
LYVSAAKIDRYAGEAEAEWARGVPPARVGPTLKASGPDRIPAHGFSELFSVRFVTSKLGAEPFDSCYVLRIVLHSLVGSVTCRHLPHVSGPFLENERRCKRGHERRKYNKASHCGQCRKGDGAGDLDDVL